MPGKFAQIRSVLAGASDSSSDFDLNPGTESLAAGPLVDAAVLAPLIERPAGLNFILTERAADLAHHAGQIAFPGGRAAPGDSGPADTALRESHEEIGLRPDQVEILGPCPCHRTTTGFRVYPFVAAVKAEFRPVLQQEEVARVFEVPFEFLTDPANFRIESAVWKGAKRRYYAVPYQTHYIWGATAAILYGLALRLQN